MGFGDLSKKTSDSQSGGTDNPFIRFEADQDVVIRILDQEPVVFWSYWLDTINGVTFRKSIIAAPNSPLKAYMDALGPDHPQFRKPRKRARVNVLDRTPVDGVPMEKVKILEYGPDLDSEFGAMHMRVRSSTDYSKKLAIWEFDILLVPTFKDPKDPRTRTIKPMKDRNEEPLAQALLALPRYDLRAMCMPLPNAAIQALLDGSDYNEVMESLGRDKAYPMV